MNDIPTETIYCPKNSTWLYVEITTDNKLVIGFENAAPWQDTILINAIRELEQMLKEHYHGALPPPPDNVRPLR
jgi:hypothetical protein